MAKQQNRLIPGLAEFARELNKSQMTLTDPRDELRHAQSPIALWTKLDDECYQQATVVDRLLTALGLIHRCQVLLTTDRRRSLVYGTQTCCGEIFLSPELGEIVP